MGVTQQVLYSRGGGKRGLTEGWEEAGEGRTIVTKRVNRN